MKIITDLCKVVRRIVREPVPWAARPSCMLASGLFIFGAILALSVLLFPLYWRLREMWR